MSSHFAQGKTPFATTPVHSDFSVNIAVARVPQQRRYDHRCALWAMIRMAFRGDLPGEGGVEFEPFISDVSLVRSSEILRGTYRLLV